jgi:seryl-tRNA synthetase
LEKSQTKIEEMDKNMSDNKNDMKRNTDELENKMNDMKNKMDENKVEIQKTMKELKNSLSSTISWALDETPPKGDIKMKGNYKTRVVFRLNNLPIIINFIVDLTLIVELITMGVLNSTFPLLN